MKNNNPTQLLAIILKSFNQYTVSLSINIMFITFICFTAAFVFYFLLINISVKSEM